MNKRKEARCLYVYVEEREREREIKKRYRIFLTPQNVEPCVE